MVYTQKDLLTLAKRHHNTKRTYLLVDPLQGKHIPVSPSASWEMLRTLGAKTAAAYPDVDLVIGFAETATAVGAVVASCMGQQCKYIHTTREAFAMSGEIIEFREEHSHAVEQFLRMDGIRECIRCARTILLVDDELSTGKTILNMVEKIREVCPEMNSSKIVAVSIISRLSDERMEILKNAGIEHLSLLRLPLEDYTAAVSGIRISEAGSPEKQGNGEEIKVANTTPDPRACVRIDDYVQTLRLWATEILKDIAPRLSGKKVTILGTEEYMLPGMIFGKILEEQKTVKSVRYHATTRSPIGISDEAGYPVYKGYRLHSFYEENRVTYIYDLSECDCVVVISDSPDDHAAQIAMEDLAGALSENGCNEMILIREVEHVRNVST